MFCCQGANARSIRMEYGAPPTVMGKLGDALGRDVTGVDVRRCRNPGENQPNTWRGILKWDKRNRPVIVDSVFSEEGLVIIRITLKEWGQILDFLKIKTKQMTDSNLRLLKDSETPDKIFYSALCLLSD